MSSLIKVFFLNLWINLFSPVGFSFAYGPKTKKKIMVLKLRISSFPEKKNMYEQVLCFGLDLSQNQLKTLSFVFGFILLFNGPAKIFNVSIYTRIWISTKNNNSYIYTYSTSEFVYHVMCGHCRFEWIKIKKRNCFII